MASNGNTGGSIGGTSSSQVWSFVPIPAQRQLQIQMQQQLQMQVQQQQQQLLNAHHAQNGTLNATQTSSTPLPGAPLPISQQHNLNPIFSGQPPIATIQQMQQPQHHQLQLQYHLQQMQQLHQQVNAPISQQLNLNPVPSRQHAIPRTRTQKTSSINPPKEENAVTPRLPLPRIKYPTVFIDLYASNDASAKKHIIHKDFAIHYSPVLHKAFTGEFKEGETHEYHLDTTEDALELFEHWLYHQSVEISHTYGTDELVTLTEAWILGDELILPAFQNQCLKKLYEVQHKKENTKTLTADDYEIIWEKTSDDSKLRMYLVDYQVAHVLKPSELAQLGELPRDMLRAMFVRAKENTSGIVRLCPPSVKLPTFNTKKYEVPERPLITKNVLRS